MRLAVAVCSALALVACVDQRSAGSRSTRSYDSSNPVHCLAIFGLTGGGASAKGDTALAADMHARVLRLAEQNGGMEWLEWSERETFKLAKELEAAPDKTRGMKLLDACMAKHPRV